jgi:hypothetical protein
MGYQNIDRDNPRFDPSSLIVTVDGIPIEWISISYSDDTDIALARAGGTSEVVGSGPGSYNPGGGTIKMHKDFYTAYMLSLYQVAVGLGAFRISAVPHVILVSYAEWNMATVTDRIEYGRFKGAQPGGAEGGTSTLITVDVPFIFHRIKWNGTIHI